MATNHQLRKRESLYEDACGIVFRAKDGLGHKLEVRKPKPESRGRELPAVEQVAWQVAIERLSGIQHPSLLPVISGGADPEDGLPYMATKPLSAETLSERLKGGPLSVEFATALLSQALEVGELLSHLLADDGMWIETEPQSIRIAGSASEPRFIFWPSPIKAMPGQGRDQSFEDLIGLTERVLNLTGKEIDERDGDHLQMWLKWLRESRDKTTVHEMREMLAAAAGVEPPGPIEDLAKQCQRGPGRLAWLPKLPPVFYQWQAPKMPLFTVLCVMLVIQAIIGWFIVSTLNDNTAKKLQQLNADYTASPYTADRDPNRKPEPGSQPLKFD